MFRFNNHPQGTFFDLLLLLFVRTQGICPTCTSACRLIVLPCRQSVSSSVLPEKPLAAKVGTAWARILPKCSTSTEHSVFFYVQQIYDMGPAALLPLRRKA
jgi:hypothetical protein